MWKNTGQQRPDFAIEPGPGQESVWDYPRPPALVACDSLVVVNSKGEELARSDECWRLLETASPPGYYLPQGHINWDALVKLKVDTHCEWKGVAKYWALAGDAAQTPVAWSYPVPRAPYSALADYVSFYPGRVECSVNGEPVTPQPGRFYGGWITPEIVGPVKGERGTGGW